jgi:hypothetical protein
LAAPLSLFHLIDTRLFTYYDTICIVSMDVVYDKFTFYLQLSIAWQLVTKKQKISVISSVRGDFWTQSVKIPVFPSLTGNTLWSVGFCLFIWGIFHRLLL